MKIEIELNNDDYEKLLNISSCSSISKEDFTQSIIKKALDNNVYLEYGYIYVHITEYLNSVSRNT
jgi:hypothetical protein